jgi:nucleoside-diphosphate-sugar epimerase
VNVLITGNLSSLAFSLIKEFPRKNDRFIVASDNAEKLNIKLSNVAVHAINPSDSIFRDSMHSYGFDIVIYISTREEELFKETDFNTGHQLDGLRNTLELCKEERLKHFFYISSTEVYGDMTEVSEETIPIPSSINGHTLSTGEEYCRIYRDTYDMKITILRLSNIYGPDERSGLLYRIVKDCKNNNQVLFPAPGDARVSFLHTADIADFIKRAIDEEYSPESLTVNLSSSNPIKFSELADLLKKHFPLLRYEFQGEKRVYTRPVTASTAKRLYYWIDLYKLSNELGKVIDLLDEEVAPSKSSFETKLKKILNTPKILKWVELILGAFLVQFLSQMTGTLFQFKYVDFRLLFVVVMGSMYGIWIGLFAFVLVSFSLLYTWQQMGFDWALLIYNVGNWFPFVLYFAAGTITGYTRDKYDNQIQNEQKRSNLIYEKYSFLYGVFNDIRALKDEFREQLIGYRDSFGKIFTITRELDQLQEQAVYLRALSILEDLMQNNNIAIYSLDANRAFARLEVNSTSLNDKLTKSLRLSDFPEIIISLERNEIFQNTALLPSYPAYVAPILNSSLPFNVPVAIIVIWSVKFEQYSTYYHNLFKVICGLVQASLVRAALFLGANYEKMYLPFTRILNHNAFMDALRIRTEMKKNKIADYQLVMVDKAEINMQEMYPKISEEIRAADLIGLCNDGNYYILLSYASESNTEDVIERLRKIGVNGLVETDFIALSQSSVSLF